MALEHLSDEEYQSLKTGGLTALNDDAYHRLKLPPGYGKTENHAQLMANGQPYAGPTEEGQSPYAGMTADAVNTAQDTLNKTIPQGLRSIAQKSANVGSLGGVVGVPALMGAELLSPETTAGKVAQGLSMAGPLVGAGMGALGELKNSEMASETGAQLLNWLPKLPMDSAKVLARDPSIVARAKSVDEVKNAYQEWAKSNDILSGTDAFEAMQEGKGSSIPYKDIGDAAYNNIKTIEDKNDLQQALTGRQAYGELLKNKWKNPSLDFDEQLVRRRQINLDKAIEDYDPSYAGLRKDYHEAMAVDDLNHVLPQNANQSPNKLALTSALMSIAGGAASGNPIAIASALGYSAAQSPLIAKQALRAASLVGKGIDFLNQDVSIPNLSGALSKIASDERGAIFPKEANGLAAKEPDATFLGMQRVPDEEGFPLFNITKKGHEMEGSTVTADTLVKNNLWPEIPDIAPKVREMVNSGKSLDQISQAIEDTQSAHKAMAEANQKAWVKMLNEGYRPAK